MGKIEGIETSINYIKDNKPLIKKYLEVGIKLQMFETIKVDDSFTFYRNNNIIDLLLFVFENMYRKDPDHRESKIPNFHNLFEAKKWMIEQYVVQIKEKHTKGELDFDQQQTYEKELKEYNNILEKLDQGSIINSAGIALCFIPKRRQELKNKNQEIMPHSILIKEINFIPKNNDMILNALDDKNVKMFLSDNRDKINIFSPLIEILSDQENSYQKDLFESLLVCDLDKNVVQDMIDIVKKCKQKNDYYDFIYRLNLEMIKGLEKQSMDNNAVFNLIKSCKMSLDKLLNFKNRGRPVGLSMIGSPNYFALPSGYVHFAEFIKKNQDIKVYNIIKNI